MYSCFFKRIFDFIVSLIGLVCVSPIFLFLVVGLKLVNKNDVFFVQVRPGRNGKLFRIIKFKTMSDEKDSEGNLLPDVQRLNKIGKFVRSASLDELPQLFNVLRGDMSIVGPRPLLPEYLILYSEEQARRHEIRPGITGWAQVNGRNAISWKRKFELDVWYVDHISVILDLRIIFMTIKKIFVREGISSETCATMEIFNGNN